MNKLKTSKELVASEFSNMWGDSPVYIAAQIGITLGKGFKDETVMRPSRDRWSAKRMEETEKEFPKKRILDAHKKYKTFNSVIAHLGIWHGTYVRLCEVYKIKPIKWDRTTKNGGASVPIIVYKLIEVPCEIYSSRLKAKQTIFPSDKKIGLRIRDGELNYDKKIDYQTDKDGRKIRARLTGKQTQIGNRTPSNEVQIYELVEEFVGEFPSREEVYRQLDNELAIRAQLKGIIYQSKGYRFYELN
jgi:hypothetical protein